MIINFMHYRTPPPRKKIGSKFYIYFEFSPDTLPITPIPTKFLNWFTFTSKPPSFLNNQPSYGSLGSTSKKIFIKKGGTF